MRLKTYADNSAVHLNFDSRAAQSAALPGISQPVSHILTSYSILPWLSYCQIGWPNLQCTIYLNRSHDIWPGFAGVPESGWILLCSHFWLQNGYPATGFRCTSKSLLMNDLMPFPASFSKFYSSHLSWDKPAWKLVISLINSLYLFLVIDNNIQECRWNLIVIIKNATEIPLEQFLITDTTTPISELWFALKWHIIPTASTQPKPQPYISMPDGCICYSSKKTADLLRFPRGIFCVPFKLLPISANVKRHGTILVRALLQWALSIHNCHSIVLNSSCCHCCRCLCCCCALYHCNSWTGPCNGPYLMLLEACLRIPAAMLLSVQTTIITLTITITKLAGLPSLLWIALLAVCSFLS